jgi:hypothetical protein
LDKLLLLAWVRECFVETNYWNFSLNYWDLREANVLFDDDLNIAGYPFITSYQANGSVIDWDNVEPQPVKLCALSLQHRITSKIVTFKCC